MAVQSTLLSSIPAGKPGSPGGSLSGRDIDSGFASVAIAFGLFVCSTAIVDGGNDESFKITVAATDVTSEEFRGVSLYDQTKASLSTPVGYSQYDAMSVVKHGKVWVRYDSATDATLNGAVYCRYATGTDGTVLGSASGTSAGSETAVVPNAKFLSKKVSVDGVYVVLIELL